MLNVYLVSPLSAFAEKNEINFKFQIINCDDGVKQSNSKMKEKLSLKL